MTHYFLYTTTQVTNRFVIREAVDLATSYTHGTYINTLETRDTDTFVICICLFNQNVMQ